MIEAPFALFRQFPRLHVAMLTKDDTVNDDAGIAAALGADTLASLNQVHGNRTIRVHGPMSRTEQADGLITDVRGLTLTTRWGDCQNFVVYAPKRNVVGLLHAGWRGLVAEAIPAFYAVLKSEWRIAPEETYVGAGPSLCKACADFTDPATELPASWKSFTDGRCVDLRAIALHQLTATGVPPAQIERHTDCTRCNPGSYWTYRGGHKEAMKEKYANVLACRLL